MSEYGDFRTGQMVRCRFNTVSPTTGAPTSLAGTPAVQITKDGNVVTPSGGVTFAADAGTVVGFNHVVIDMSVDPTTFTAGSDYAARMSAGTVGGISVVGIVVGEWSVQNRSGSVTLGTLTVTGTPTTTTITGTSGNLGTTSGEYTGRKLYFDGSTSWPFGETGVCTHTYTGGTHTFSFATPNNGVPTAGDVGKVI